MRKVFNRSKFVRRGKNITICRIIKEYYDKESIKKCIMLAFVMLLMLSVPVKAADPGCILAKGIQDESVVLFIQDPGTDTVSIQIGTEKCDDITVSDISDETVETLVLVDNSLSIAQKYRPVVNDILTNIAANRGVSEKFSVATFTDQTNYLLRNSSDYSEIKRAIDSIQYDSHDSYLLPVLYECFSAWAKEDELVYRKVIVISDGASEETVGYTLNELNELIRRYPYPVYSFGAAYQNNSNKEQLDNLFSLSRVTNGESWRIGDISDSLAVSTIIASSNNVKKVSIQPPVTMCDGTEKGIKIEAGGHVDQTTIVMPFAKMEHVVEPAEPIAETAEPTEAVTPEVAEENEFVADSEDAPKASNSVLWIVVGILVFFVCAAGGFFFARKKNQTNTKNDLPEEQRDTEPVQTSDDGDTGIVMRGAKGDTAVVFSNQKKKTPVLILTNVGTPNERYKSALIGPITVGRSSNMGCNIIIPENTPTKTVSKKHCIFTYDGNALYVADAGSKNGTLVNGVLAEGRTRVESGNTITLGDVELRVEIKNA